MEKVNLKEVVLKSGKHKYIEEGACIMEMVSYMANEPWSDRPKCACPILTEYAIRLNDKFTDKDRQKMKPFIKKLISTRLNDETQIARKRLIRWRNVTVTFPLIIDAIGGENFATKLRKFKNNEKSMAEAAKFLNENKAEMQKLADANANANANANAYAYAYANANAYAYANANADADAYANAYAYADAYANAYAYAYANANANAYANADAYAYANADAKKFKKLKADIVKVSLETLKLAIAIKAK